MSDKFTRNFKKKPTQHTVLMQSLMGETTAVAHGGNPQDRAASPRPRCIALKGPRESVINSMHMLYSLS